MKEAFMALGVSEDRFEGSFGASFEKGHQLNVLVQDIDNEAWEKAHFALYCSAYPETEAWGRMMRTANRFYRQGERTLCLAQLQAMAVYLGEENEVNGQKQ